MEEVSNNIIKKKGKSIQKKLLENKAVTDEDLSFVQDFRLTFKDELIRNFKIIEGLADRAGSDTICSFRLKRIESILSKLKREKTMKLTTMGDIAGCRIIVYREAAIPVTIELLEKIYNVKKIKDYFFNGSKSDGYKGYHLYVQSRNSNKTFEIQIRTIHSHRWASMVEIIDNIFSKKIKEGEKHYKLNRFLKLLSDKRTLSIEEKKELIDIDYKVGLIQNLSKTFIKNNTNIRKQWLELSSEKHEYYLFKIVENNDLNVYIEGFNDSKSAESKYFIESQLDKVNCVIAKIQKPTFKRVCTAYSSYTLNGHEYIDDWFDFMLEILKNQNNLINKNDFEFYKSLLNQNIDFQFELITEELDGVISVKNSLFVEDELKEWKLDINDKAKKMAQIKYDNLDKGTGVLRLLNFFKKSNSK